MILGKKQVKNKREYMQVYGVGIDYTGKGVSQSNQSRHDLRRVYSRKLPVGSKLAPINILESKNKRPNLMSLEYIQARKDGSDLGGSLVNKLRDNKIESEV